MATQFYSALNYLNSHHGFVPVNDSPAVSDPQGDQAEYEADLQLPQIHLSHLLVSLDIAPPNL